MKAPAGAMGKTVACVKCGAKIKVSVENTTPIEPPARPPVNDAPRPTRPAAAVSAATQAASPAGAPAKTAPAATPAKAPVTDTAPLGDDPVVNLLRKHGLATAPQVEEALLVQKDIPRSTWELLIDLGHVSSEDFHALMSKQDGVTNIDLANYKVPGDVLQFIPPDVVKQYAAFPVDKLGKLLTVAMACPVDTRAVAEVQNRTDLKARIMLAKLEDVRATILKFYPQKRPQAAYDDAFAKDLDREFHSLLEVNEAAARVFDFEALSPFDHAVKRLLTSAKDPNTPLKELVDIVLTDPATALRLLALANSAAYGFARKVDNAGLAVALVGRAGLIEFFEGTESADYLGRKTAFDAKTFWQRARFCSKAAEAVAQAIESQRTVAATTAGLLQAVGRLAFEVLFPNSHGRVTGKKSGQALLETEQRVYHLTHPEAGYILARKANLPPTLTEPIRYAYNPDAAQKSKEVVSIVSLATAMADAYAGGGPFEIAVGAPALARLNMPQDKAMKAYKQAVAAMGG